MAGPDDPQPWLADADALRLLLRAVFAAADASRPTVVAKPIASGGTLGAREFTADELSALVAYLHELGPALVQPYVTAIDAHRELGVVTLDGTDVTTATTGGVGGGEREGLAVRAGRAAAECRADAGSPAGEDTAARCRA